MAARRNLNKFKCCALNTTEHYLKTPKVLSCGDYICSKCIDSNGSDNIECGKCGETNKLDLSIQPICTPMQDLIKIHLNDLTKEVYSKLNEKKESIEVVMNELNARIESQFEFIESEIELRIESFKVELDKIGTNMKIKAKELKEKIKKFSIIEMEQNFYKLNDKINDLDTKLKNIQTFDSKVNFNLNETSTINEKDVGSFEFYPELLENKLLNAKVEHIQLDHDVFGIVQLKTGDILISTFHATLAVYDKDFQFIRKIEKINNERAYGLGLATDSNGNIFVTSYTTIYKLDAELNYLSSKLDSRIVNYNRIWISENKLYSCSASLKCIDVHDLDLNLVSTHYLEDEPSQIKILNDVACINFSEIDKTCFYKLPSFKKIHEYNFRCSILPYNDRFYMYNKNLRIFDKNGKLIKTIDCDYGRTKYLNSAIIIMDNCLFIVLKDKELVKIKLN